MAEEKAGFAAKQKGKGWTCHPFLIIKGGGLVSVSHSLFQKSTQGSRLFTSMGVRSACPPPKVLAMATGQDGVLVLWAFFLVGTQGFSPRLCSLNYPRLGWDKKGSLSLGLYVFC